MRRNFKKLLSILLVAVMIFGSAPLAGFVGLELPEFNLFSTKAKAATYSGICGEKLTWTLDTETGELVISGTGSMSGYTYPNPPWYQYISSIKSVTIENGVTSIGDDAFYYYWGLTSVTIPDSVTSIGSSAFYNCYNLKTVYYSGTPEQWNDISFEQGNKELLDNDIICECNSERPYYGGECGKNLTWKLYTDGELVISGTGAMDYWMTNSDVPWYGVCSSIKSVTISDGVTSISQYAFDNCENITDVFYTGDLAGWCGIEFVTTSSNPMFYANNLYINQVLLEGDIIIPDSITKLNDYVFAHCSSLISVTIPDRVTIIGKRAFYECSNLTNVKVSNGLTTIGDYAFQKCTNLANIEIPGSVTSIGYLAFSSCSNLIKITVDPENTIYSSDENGVLFNKDKTELIYYPKGNKKTSYIIPDSTTKICDFAFSNCSNLISIETGDGVINIGKNAFDRCFNLKNAIIGNSVTNMSDFAFEYCENLESVIIGNSVTNIGWHVFYNCSNLVTVTIGYNVRNIGNYTFKGCNSLEDVYYIASPVRWNSMNIGTDNEPLLNATIHYNHIHSIDIIEDSLASTCTESGYKKGICICKYSYTEETPALKHDIVIDKAVDATCTETGLTEGQHCSRCDDMTVEQEVVPALNHKNTLIKVEAKAPTCTEIGWDAYEYCTACTYTTYKEKTALKHDIIIDEVVEATCTETGLTKGQHCSRCDNMTVKQEVVPVKPHNHTAKHDSAKHWKECVCGSKINIQNHSFVGGNTCSCGFKRIVDSTIKIKNNNGSKTINYGETLKLTANVTNKPANAKIYWYIDGEKKGEGEVFNVKFESGTKIITVKLVDENGVVYQNASDAEITDSENVTVKGGFFQKLISFFKNLFGINRTVVQVVFKGVF